MRISFDSSHAALDARTIEMTKQLKITIEIIPLDIGPESPLTGHVSNCWKSPPRTAPKNAIAATFRVIRFLLNHTPFSETPKNAGGLTIMISARSLTLVHKVHDTILVQSSPVLKDKHPPNAP